MHFCIKHYCVRIFNWLCECSVLSLFYWKMVRSRFTWPWQVMTIFINDFTAAGYKMLSFPRKHWKGDDTAALKRKILFNLSNSNKTIKAKQWHWLCSLDYSQAQRINQLMLSLCLNSKRNFDEIWYWKQWLCCLRYQYTLLSGKLLTQSKLKCFLSSTLLQVSQNLSLIGAILFSCCWLVRSKISHWSMS